MWHSSMLLVFPAAYILLDTFLVVFINVTSVHGKTSYSTVTANALTEFIKLGVALYGVLSSNSWRELIGSLTLQMVLKFGASNALYAVNNNLFHYSIGAVSPAVFVVSINAMRTILTAIFQRLVSGKELTGRQIVACVLLALSFIFTSLGDILEIVYFGNFRGSKFSLLLLLAGAYSSISVCASLVQEKLLKDAPSLMIANVINYSYGLFLQLSMVIYFKARSPEVSVFRGFDIFWIQLIPVLMALSGISISFVLKYFDNIVKLLCSSIAVLLVHTVTAYMSGGDMFDICFICGWLLTMPAAYLYYVTPPSTTPIGTAIAPLISIQDKEKSEDDSSIAVAVAVGELNDRREKYTAGGKSHSTSASISSRGAFVRNSLRVIVVGGLILIPIYNSSFDLPSAHSGNGVFSAAKYHVSSGDGTLSFPDSCPLYEVPYDDSKSHLKNLATTPIHSGAQFSRIVSNNLVVNCPADSVYVLRPDITLHNAPLGGDITEFEWLHLNVEDIISAEKKKSITRNNKPDLDIAVKTTPSSPVIKTNSTGVTGPGLVTHTNTGSKVNGTAVTTKHIRRALSSTAGADTTHSTHITHTSETNTNSASHTEYSIPLSSVLPLFGPDNATLPYFWVNCRKKSSVNLVVLPAGTMRSDKKERLSAAEKKEVQDYIQALSIAPALSSKETKGKSTSAAKAVSSAVPAVPEPVFDSVLVIYLDAISRLKFNNFYKQSRALIESIDYQNLLDGTAADGVGTSTHVSVELTKFHALGINSHVNYLPMMSGIEPDESLLRFKQAPVHSKQVDVDNDKQPAATAAQGTPREPWLFDLAEAMGFETLSGYNGCHTNCEQKCHEKFLTHDNIEVGGYTKQYMQDSANRAPGMSNWPSASTCESMFRPEVRSKMCAACQKEEKPLPLANMLDWTLDWLSDNPMDAPKKRFASIVFEDTHRHGHAPNFDADLESFLRKLLFPPADKAKNVKSIKTDKLAVLLLADHGMHFGPEYMTGTGKIANKQPFAQVLLPASYAATHETEMSALAHNAKLLTTHFDLRATVQHWLTGRDWSASTLKAATTAANAAIAKSNPVKKVFASQHGNSIFSAPMPTNRTCDQAGISPTFCGCNLTPCENNVRPLVKAQFAAVADFMNGKVFTTSPHADSVCIPLTAGDFMFVPGGFDCLAVERETLRTFEVNLVVTRNNALIGVTFGQDLTSKGDKKDDKKHSSKPSPWRVISVNTASNYGRVWPQCAQQFVDKKMEQYNTIEPTNWQYCYCKTKREINYGPWLKVLGWFYQ